MAEEEKDEATSMEEILVVRGSSDILSPLYFSLFSDGSCEYPTMEHYCQCQLMTHMGLITEAQQILDDKTAVEAAARGNKLVRENMPPGTTPEYISCYVSVCRDSFIRQGYKLRYEKDEDFRNALKATGKAVLISCDAYDKEDGIGMDESNFWYWVQQEKVTPQQLLHWLIRPHLSQHKHLGKNRLGKVLMGLRDGKDLDAADDGDLLPLAYNEPENDSQQTLFTVGDLSLSEQILALTGMFRPLSNFYPTPLIVRGKRYRSVEHYVYTRLLKSLKVDTKVLEKVRTTSNPAKLSQVTERSLKGTADSTAIMKNCNAVWASSSEKWYKRAITAKFQQYNGLTKLLLSTGNAVLIETGNQFDRDSSIGTDETEIQHLMTKKYVDPTILLGWLKCEEEPPKRMGHLGLNKSGFMLMEERKKISETAQPMGLMPLVLPTDSAIYGLLSEHLICFTTESVFHPAYDAPVEEHGGGGTHKSVQHFVCLQGARYFDFPSSSVQYLKDYEGGVKVASEFAFEVEERCPPIEQVFAWEYSGQVEATKQALRLRFEQNPALLRALLDTGDALLVFCKRFESRTCEWSIGMRERDLRCWMHVLRMDTRQLAELCAKPLSKRPCYLGGNRLGFLLMELRREFTLRGVFPHNLPQLPMGPEMILGSDSIMEDSVEDFDTEQEYEASIWPNPFLLMEKTGEDENLWTQANTVTKGRVWRQEQKEEAAKPSPEEDMMKPTEWDKDELNNMDEDDLRALIMEFVSNKLRGLLHATQVQEDQLMHMESELNRVRSTRRQLESEREEREKRMRRAAENAEEDKDKKLQSIKSKLAALITESYKPASSQQQSNERQDRVHDSLEIAPTGQQFVELETLVKAEMEDFQHSNLGFVPTRFTQRPPPNMHAQPPPTTDMQNIRHDNVHSSQPPNVKPEKKEKLEEELEAGEIDSDDD